MAQPGSALPFLLRRKTDVVGMMEITSTTEVSHGLLRIEEDTLVVQWSTARETQLVGLVMKTDRELDPGLVLEHPAELTLGIRRRDRALAREFAGDLEMHLADQALRAAERRERVTSGDKR